MRFHGTISCYAGGCRCTDCTTAARDYKRSRRSNRTPGTSNDGYTLEPRPDVMPSFFTDPARNCADVPTDVFYPHGNEASAGLAVCASCPVRGECADWGLRYELHGSWGGLTAPQRDRLRKQTA